jgi:hypothetical protein
MQSYGWAAGLLLLLFGSTDLRAEVAEASYPAQTAAPTDPPATAQQGDASSETSSGEATADEKKWKFATIGYAGSPGRRAKRT